MSDSVISMGAGLGIQLVTAFQDLGQLQQVYGHHRATTVANNHRARILLGGVGDTATLDYMSALIGDQIIQTTSTSTDRRGGRSTTDNQQLQPLAPAASLRTLPDGDAVCVYGNLAPIRMKLRPWYRDQRLSRRINEPSAPAPTTTVPPSNSSASRPNIDGDEARFQAALTQIRDFEPPPPELLDP